MRVAAPELCAPPCAPGVLFVGGRPLGFTPWSFAVRVWGPRSWVSAHGKLRLLKGVEWLRQLARRGFRLQSPTLAFQDNSGGDSECHAAQMPHAPAPSRDRGRFHPPRPRRGTPQPPRPPQPRTREPQFISQRRAIPQGCSAQHRQRPRRVSAGARQFTGGSSRSPWPSPKPLSPEPPSDDAPPAPPGPPAPPPALGILKIWASWAATMMSPASWIRPLK